MTKARISLTIRIDADQHEKLSQIAQLKGTSLTATIKDAFTAYIDNQKIVEFRDTSHPDYWIRTTLNNGCYEEITLGCSNAGTEHITVNDIPQESAAPIFELLENSINSIENVLGS